MDLLNQLGIRIPLLLAHIVSFLVMYAVLKHFLFEPVRRHIQARQEALTKERAGVVALKAACVESEGSLKQRKEQIERQAYDQLQALVRDGQGSKAEALRAAQEQARAVLAEARAAAIQEHERALTSLEDDVVDLTATIMAWVLRREAGDKKLVALSQSVASEVLKERAGS